MVESIPINNKLETKIETNVPIDNNKDVAERLGINRATTSFRDIVNLLITFIKGTSLFDELTLAGRLDDLHKLPYSAQYLLFDFCLAALEGDYLDAKLFLGHAFQVLGLSNQVNLLLYNCIYSIDYRQRCKGTQHYWH